MENNYKIYSLNDELLEVVDELSHSSYGKPGLTKERAIATGKKCYYKKIPGSPKDIRTNKEVFKHFHGNADCVWVLVFKDILGGQNATVVKDDANVKPFIERLVQSSRVESEDEVEVHLRKIW